MFTHVLHTLPKKPVSLQKGHCTFFSKTRRALQRGQSTFPNFWHPTHFHGNTASRMVLILFQKNFFEFSTIQCKTC